MAKLIKFYDQLRGDDCLSACLASVLDVPQSEVPVFVSGDDYLKFWTSLTEWLHSRGLHPVWVPFSTAAQYFITSYTIVTGQSPRWPNDSTRKHAVIFREDRIAHDPSPTRAGLIGEPERMLLFTPWWPQPEEDKS